MITIRKEQPGDADGIRAVNEEAFGQPGEADIVDRLRKECPDSLSLVAVSDQRIVGHILFSPVSLRADGGDIHGMGLGPMAVLSGEQCKGIGSRMVETGLGLLREQSCPFVVVLGHPEYYPRFGFVPASQYGIKCQWDGVPDQAFMVLVLDEPAVAGVRGVARYRGRV